MERDSASADNETLRNKIPQEYVHTAESQTLAAVEGYASTSAVSLSLSLLFASRLTSPLIHPQFAPTGIYIWVVLLRKPGAINSPFLSALNVTRRRIKLRPPEEQASSENRSENGVNRRASPLSPLFLFLFFSFFYVRINVANGRIFIFRANVRLVPSKGEKAVPKFAKNMQISLSLSRV